MNTPEMPPRRPLWVSLRDDNLLVCQACGAVGYRADWPRDSSGYPWCPCDRRRVPDEARHLPRPDGGGS